MQKIKLVCDFCAHEEYVNLSELAPGERSDSSIRRFDLFGDYTSREFEELCRYYQGPSVEGDICDTCRENLMRNVKSRITVAIEDSVTELIENKERVKEEVKEKLEFDF